MPTIASRVPRVSSATATLVLPALLALLTVIPATGCVPAARHQKTVAELERARRQNLELQRDLVEQRVRLQEMTGAGSSATASARAEAAAPMAAPPLTEERPSPVVSRTPASVAVTPGIEEEEIRDPEPALAAAVANGERILWVARKYSAEGKMVESISVYSRFIHDYPFSPLLPEALMARARDRLKTGDRSGALEDFQTVAEAFPASTEATEARREAARLGGS